MSVFKDRAAYFHPRTAMTATDGRAGEETGPVEVGDQALMRGLDTAVPSMRPRLSLSKSGRRRCRPHNVLREFLCRGPVPTLAPSWESGERVGYTTCASLPIAQTNPESSRARAVTVTVCLLPLAENALYRAHSRVCALIAMSRTAGGTRC
jgi:hypothetical protein